MRSPPRAAAAEALGLVVPEQRPLLLRLAKLRNKFAHGQIDDLRAADAGDLARLVGELLVQTTGTDPYEAEGTSARERLRDPPILALRAALTAARMSVRTTSEIARLEEDLKRRIVEMHRALMGERATLAQRLAEAEEPHAE